MYDRGDTKVHHDEGRTKQECDLPLSWLCCEEPLKETHDLKAQLFAVRAPKTPVSVRQLDALVTLTRAPPALRLSIHSRSPPPPFLIAFYHHG